MPRKCEGGQSTVFPWTALMGKSCLSSTFSSARAERIRARRKLARGELFSGFLFIPIRLSPPSLSFFFLLSMCALHPSDARKCACVISREREHPACNYKLNSADAVYTMVGTRNLSTALEWKQRWMRISRSPSAIHIPYCPFLILFSVLSFSSTPLAVCLGSVSQDNGHLDAIERITSSSMAALAVFIKRQ